MGNQKSQDELDNIAKDLANQMLDDVRAGKLHQSQLMQPNWFEQKAAQHVAEINNEMRHSQTQSQFMGSGSRYQTQQQQQQQSMYGQGGGFYRPSYSGSNREVEQIDSQKQTPIFDDAYYTQTSQTSAGRGNTRPVISSSQHSIYDHIYEETVPNYRGRVVYPANYEDQYDDKQVHLDFDHRNPVLIRPGSGSVRVNFTLSTYNKTSSSPGAGTTHVLTFNRNFTEADKREQIQSIIEEITKMNRTQMQGMDDIISSLIIQLDDNSSATDKQYVQEEIFKLIESIRNQYGSWNYPAPHSEGRVTEEELLYKEVQELIQNFGTFMKNHSQTVSSNSLSSYIQSVQHTLTYEERQTQAVVIQQEIRRLTEEIRIWTTAQNIQEQERMQQIHELQEEIRQLREILRQWNVPVSSNTEQVSTHIIQIQNQLSSAEKQRQQSLIQTEIERLRQEMQRWQDQRNINEQQRQQQVNMIFKEISTLSQIIEDWKYNQQTQVAPQNQLSTHIVTIENNLTEEEKDYQSQVIQDEIQRLRQEMASYSQTATTNDRKRQDQIMLCRQEINKLTEIIEDWKASKPTITAENQLSTHIIQIENNLSEQEKSYQTNLITTEIERLREELERWKHLHHVNENKRQEQIRLIHTEMNKLTQIIEEWKHVKPAITVGNQLSTHIIQIESNLTENQKEQQTVLVTNEIERLRQELEKWKQLQNVNEEKRQQQVQMIRQEITKLTEIIQEWKETKPTIVPGNQLSQQIITIEKTFTEEDRHQKNTVIQQEINRLREELQRWSQLQNVNEQKREEQVRLIKLEISKLTEIVEEWKEVSRPVIVENNRLSTHYITIENSLTEEEKIQQSSVIQQEITRLKEEMEKWRQLQHVNEQSKQQQVQMIRQEISKLTEIIQDWKEHKPTLTTQNLLSSHVIQIENNLSDMDKEHQSIVIREEIDRLRQEMHRWSQMHNVNEQKRQQQVQMIRQEITKLTEIIEQWKETKSSINVQNQLSAQIITQESGFTEEEKIQKTAVIESEIQRLRTEMERWSQMQNVNEQKRQQQVQMIRVEISKLTEIINEWKESQVEVKPESLMSLHIISIANKLSETDRRRQVSLIRQEIQRLQTEFEKWNRLTHVRADKKQQQIYVIWEEITALKRILEDWNKTYPTGDGSLLSSHMISIEKTLTEEEKLLQTVVIKEEITRLKEELEKFMRDTNNPNRQREILWIRKEIDKLNQILQNWKLTETANNKGQLSTHVLSIEHTLSDDQKLQQTVIIKEELIRLSQELEKWKKNRGDRQERDQQIFWIRQEMNKLNEILAGWSANEQIGTGGQLSSYIISIMNSLNSDQKEAEAVKIRQEIIRLNNDLQKWQQSHRSEAEKSRQVTIIRNEITILTQILEDWELERLSPDFKKLSTHILHIDHTMTDGERERNEEIIRKEIYRLTQVLDEWRNKGSVNEEERTHVILLIQREIDLLKNIMEEWRRKIQDKSVLSAFIRRIEGSLDSEGKYYYSLLMVQEIVRLQRESARWRAAHENQENQCWYISNKNPNISFDQEKQRQLKMIREEVERLVEILKEWGWRKSSNGRWIHKTYTPQYCDTTTQPGVFIYEKTGSTTGLARPPQKLISKNRGDQPPQHFEDDYISEEELEAEPGIGLYPVKPVPLAPLVSSTPVPLPPPTRPQLPQQKIDVYPTQREYRRREYQKTTITTTGNVAQMVSY